MGMMSRKLWRMGGGFMGHINEPDKAPSVFAVFAIGAKGKVGIMIEAFMPMEAEGAFGFFVHEIFIPAGECHRDMPPMSGQSDDSGSMT